MALGLPPPKFQPIKEKLLHSRRQIRKIDRKGSAVGLSSDSGDDVDSNGDSSEDEGSDDDQDLQGFVVSDEGYSDIYSELLALKEELNRLKEKERSVKQKIKSSKSNEKRSKGKKKLKKLSIKIQGTGEAITAMMKELAALKEKEDNNSSLDSLDSSSDFSDSSDSADAEDSVDTAGSSDELNDADLKEIASKKEELSFLQEELDGLKEQERSIKKQIKQSKPEKERKKGEKKLMEVLQNRVDIDEAITAVMNEIATLEGSGVSEDDEATQLRADIEDAKERGQIYKVKVLERKLKVLH